MIGWRLSRILSKDSADEFKDSLLAVLSSSINCTDFSTRRVTFDKQTVEFGEASPNDDCTKPAEKP